VRAAQEVLGKVREGRFDDERVRASAWFFVFCFLLFWTDFLCVFREELVGEELTESRAKCLSCSRRVGGRHGAPADGGGMDVEPKGWEGGLRCGRGSGGKRWSAAPLHYEWRMGRSCGTWWDDWQAATHAISGGCVSVGDGADVQKR
jgi:hypothetical protein